MIVPLVVVLEREVAPVSGRSGRLPRRPLPDTGARAAWRIAKPLFRISLRSRCDPLLALAADAAIVS